MNKYLEIAIKEAELAMKDGEIPIGAVIVKNGVILAQKHNLKETLKCATKHAEILAIEEASSKLQSWRLNECELYVTVEPCMMCCGALIQSRIKKIYYLLDNEKFGGIDNLINNRSNHQVIIEKINNPILEEKALNMLKKFFNEKR